MKEANAAFWAQMQHLVVTRRIIIDRPKGNRHPRYSEMIYPLDYGYLENTTSSDGGGIDVWIGSLGTRMLTGILCTFDTLKQDAEIKLLLGCDENDLNNIRAFHGEEMKILHVPLEYQ